MNEERRELYVGLTVIIGVIVLVGGIFWGKNSSVFSKKELFSAFFDSASGLKPGDDVVVRGIKSGKVQDVRLDEDRVIVSFRVESQVILYSDMRISIQGLELMGSRVLVINPGMSGMPADSKKIYEGSASAGMGELLANITATMVSADSMLISVREFLDMENLKGSVTEFNRAVAGLRSLVAENRQGITATVDRIERISTMMEQDSVMYGFSRALQRADSTLREIQEAVGGIRGGTGSLGRIMTDTTLYWQFVNSAAQLDSLIQDIQKNPSKYVRVSIF